MPVEVFHYRPLAIARICARETGVLIFQLLPIVISNPLMHYLRTRDLTESLSLLQAASWIMPIFAILHCCWRIPRLWSVVVQFDGDVLVKVDNNDRRGLAANEVAAIIETPRLIHIISGRPDYTITLHCELDKFSGLRAKLGAWLPPNTKCVPPPGRQTAKGVLVFFSLQILAFLSLAWYRSSYFKIGYWFPIGVVLVLLLSALFWWRKIMKSDWAEPDLPSYLVP
jgi:hypothetical protein